MTRPSSAATTMVMAKAVAQVGFTSLGKICTRPGSPMMGISNSPRWRRPT